MNNSSTAEALEHPNADFYERFGLSGPIEPDPAKRLRHRMTFRNERALYKRTSTKSGKSIISIYHPNSPYVVYSTDEWWSDSWDGTSFGKDFDFSRTFFEQFIELQKQVPRISLFNVNPYNSDYCQQAYNNKNSYLCTVVKDCEDSLYISHSNTVTDSMDCDYVQSIELCYDCMDSENLYNCISCDNCHNCNELLFCFDCIGCSNCLGCWGLRNQKYHIFNVQYPKEEYEAMLAKLKMQSYATFSKWAKQCWGEIKKGNERQWFNVNTEECQGNHLVNAKSCYNCYDSFGVEECSNSTWIFDSHHCADIYGMGTSEWVYESVGVENLNFGAFNTFVSDSSESFYSDLCFYTHNIFGCVGLRHKKNCILNKEYSTDEFNALKAKIIEHMKKTGEWGKFFPSEASPFAYNESVAYERFPLSQTEAEQLGYTWREEEDKTYQEQSMALPDNSAEAPPDITKAVLSCEVTGKNFKITPQELLLYQQLKLPLPRRCPDQRYIDRMDRRKEFLGG